MARTRFSLLLYEDEFFCRLRENWLLQLQAFEGVCSVWRPHQKTKFKISVPEQVLAYNRPGFLHFYASCPDVVFEN